MNYKRKKTDKLDLIKIKNVHCSRDTIKKMKAKTELNKTFAIYISNKGVVSRIYVKTLLIQK